MVSEEAWMDAEEEEGVRWDFYSEKQKEEENPHLIGRTLDVGLLNSKKN